MNRRYADMAKDSLFPRITPFPVQSRNRILPKQSRYCTYDLCGRFEKIRIEPVVALQHNAGLPVIPPHG